MDWTRALATWLLVFVAGLLLAVPVLSVVFFALGGPEADWVFPAAVGAYAALVFWAVWHGREKERKGRALGARSRGLARRMAGEQIRAPGLDARYRF